MEVLGIRMASAVYLKALVSISVLFLTVLCSSWEDIIFPESSEELVFPKQPGVNISNFIEDTGFSNNCAMFEAICWIKCTKTSNLNVAIANLLAKEKKKNQTCQSLSLLEIAWHEFPDNILRPNWVSVGRMVYELEIRQSSLYYIEPEAFSSSDFDKVLSLRLIKLKLLVLAGGMLLGLARLENLVVIGPIVAISKTFFQPVRTSLRHLKLSGMNSLVEADNIFGISDLTALEHLDLSGNDFIGPIRQSAFQRLSKVLYLNLSRSRITALGVDPFASIAQTLRILDLSDNEIMVLNYENFASLVETHHSFIYLGQNHLICNCSLESFVQTYAFAERMFVDVPLCKGPPQHVGKWITDVEYVCPHNSTASPTSVTKIDHNKSSTPGITFVDDEVTLGSFNITPPFNFSSTPYENHSTFETFDTSPSLMVNITTEETPKDLVELTCFSQGDETDDVESISYLYLPPPQYDFKIELISRNSVRIVIEEFEKPPNIIWYDYPDNVNILDYGDNSTGCRFYENNTAIVDSLVENVSYTFCLMPDGEEKITPFNCLPFYVPPTTSEEDEIWITHDQKSMVITIYCFVILACAVVGAVSTYYCVRENPTLLKGSKHVFIVEESEATEISTISGSDSLRRRDTVTEKKRDSTPPRYGLDLQDRGTPYEVPIDVGLYSQITKPKRHLEVCPRFEVCPKSPPPLPKRNSEPICHQLGVHVVRVKKSV